MCPACELHCQPNTLAPMLPACSYLTLTDHDESLQCTIAHEAPSGASAPAVVVGVWARARAPTAAPLSVSWDPWTNFSFSARQWDRGTCGNNKCYFPELTLTPLHRLATGKRPRASVTQRVGRWAGLYSRRVKSKRTCQAGCGRGSSPKTYTHDMEPEPSTFYSGRHVASPLVTATQRF